MDLEKLLKGRNGRNVPGTRIGYRSTRTKAALPRSSRNRSADTHTEGGLLTGDTAKARGRRNNAFPSVKFAPLLPARRVSATTHNISREKLSYVSCYFARPHDFHFPSLSTTVKRDSPTILSGATGRCSRRWRTRHTMGIMNHTLGT